MSTWQAELAGLVPAELLGAEDNARIPPLQYAVQVGEYSPVPHVSTQSTPCEYSEYPM